MATLAVSVVAKAPTFVLVHLVDECVLSLSDLRIHYLHRLSTHTRLDFTH